ncbi:MAG: bifunctional serine/threonine-protein kinase/formylglycine-generating enzyme family protein [Planctomycetota bacterium]
MDLDRALSERPELEHEMRDLHARWLRLEAVIAGFSGQSRVLEELEREIVSAPPDPASLEVLERIARRGNSAGRYEFRDRVGHGGMGVVFRVHDRDLDRDLALKVLRRTRCETPLASSQPRTERFLAEARLAARLDHPGIVPVHDVGIDGQGRLFFTMRLVQGEDLRTVLRRVRAGESGWTRVRALEVLIKVCDTVAFAHSNGIIHRDLKPANVMVGRYGEAYVLDWGLARSLTPHPSTERRGVAGTPAYMAPEQAAGEAAGPSADVYSIGAMIYELLGGRRPYEGQAHAGFDAILALVRAGPPVDIEGLARHADPELLAICRKAMGREPRERYASASELADDLRAYLEGRVVRAHAKGALVEMRKWIGRNRALAAALATALLCALGSLGAVSLLEARGKAEILRLADSRRLAELERRADALWPAVPGNVGGLRAWLLEAEGLALRREVHAADLERLRAQPFPDTERRWRVEALASLVEDLGRLADPNQGLIASVRERMDFASGIEGRTLVAGASAWREAVDSITDRRECPRYGGLRLEPVVGLLPIGRDRESGLWEFADLATGEPPARRADGGLEIGPESAIVFVLLPPGEFEMGSRTESLTGDPPGDPWARENESPPTPCRMDPYFLAKHELTRAQWNRASSGRPWRSDPVRDDALLPAAGVSFDDARAVLARLGLRLPSEEQWEYAARADTRTRWWCGDQPGSLAGCANGARAPEAAPPGLRTSNGPSRVDRLRGNPFGLHHVHGNVAEWTGDPWRPRHDAPPALEPLRCVRGGSYSSPAVDLRSAARAGFAPDIRSPEIGLRPVRLLRQASIYVPEDAGSR